MKKNTIKRVVCLVAALWFGVFAPVPVFALSEEDLHTFSMIEAYFYDPSNTDCNGNSNGIWKGKQYNLSDDEILGLARVIVSENSCNMTAVKNVASIMANQHESNANYKNKTIVDYVRNSGWYGSAAPYTNSSVSVSAEQIEAVKDVLINGNRTIPPEVVEYDCLGDIKWIENDGVKKYNNNPGGCNGTALNDKSLYVPGKTKIHNVYTSTFIFYGWAGGPESDCGDAFGYFENNPPSGSYSEVAGSNTNYSGAQVFSDAEKQAIEDNEAIYKEAAEEYDFPWQILAVLHKMETGLKRRNPDNGQGVYQLYSYTGGGSNDKRFEPADSITEEEFKRQTKIAAKIVKEKAKENNIDLKGSNSDGIKKFFFVYNGMAKEYIDKAIAMGFTQEQANNGEGSAYVMNRYDARRDPTSDNMDPLWKGRYTGDNKYDPNATSKNFGAYVQYEALAGSGDNCKVDGLEDGGFKSLDEAKEFMKYYKNKARDNRYKRPVTLDGIVHSNNCTYGALANCVSFTKWFINKYASGGPYNNIGNGKEVVANLINEGFEDGGHTPRAYAVFSRQSGASGWGHTGIILGVDTARKKVIIGEAACGLDVDYIDAKEKDLDEFSSNDYTYAYTDKKLKEGL